MARVFYVHWNREEAGETVRTLREAGHTVVLHHSTEEGAGARAWKSIKTRPPDVLVVSLTRLPSHGRRVAAVTTATRKLAALPVVFVDGEPEKIAVARQEFPRAKFTSSGRLLTTVGAATRRRAGR